MLKTQPVRLPRPCKRDMKTWFEPAAEVSMVAPLCRPSHWLRRPALVLTEAQIRVSFLIGQLVLQRHGNRDRGTSHCRKLSHHLPGVGYDPWGCLYGVGGETGNS